ncbi:MAG: permease [Rhodothermaceae bacterium]|nr:MAG: permease [Rhodothermaceae bacterium]
MAPLLLRAGLRYLLRHPWLLALSILGVALGVSVVVAIDLASGSARRAFELSAETVTGRATHLVVGPTERGLPEDVYRRLRLEAGVRAAAPVVEGYVAAVADSGRTFHLLGVDPLAEGPFRSYAGREAGLDLGAFLTQPGAALMAGTTARAMGLAPGDTLAVRVEGRPARLHLVGLMEGTDTHSAEALDGLLVVDIATAQELLGRTGRLSRIDLIVPEGAAGAALLERLRAVLPPGAEVVRSATRTETVEQMTRAFELNLTALSLLALVVGMFLIYNTMTFSVVQRRPLLGRLRVLGVTRREVFTLVLGEALLIGLAGTVLGGLLGVVLGQGLVRLVTRTINDLYYVVTVRELYLAPLTLAKGVALGLGATLAAAFFPAREAAETPAGMVLQASVPEARARRRAPRLALAGVALGGAGGVLLLLSGRSIGGSYAALFCLLLGFALATPWAVQRMARMARPVMGRLFGLTGRMAASGIVAALSRTAVAIAALTIALAATIGVGVMVDSFRLTVDTWLGYALQADVYVQPPSLVLREGEATLRPEVLERLRTTPGVAAAYSVRRLDVASNHGRVRLVAVDRGPMTPSTFRLKAGDPDVVWSSFEDGASVLVSEPYSYRHRTGVGDTLRLQTDHGERPFVVRGIYYDYASDRGVVLMSRATFERHFDDRLRSGLALYAAPGEDLDALMARLRSRVEGMQEVFIRSNRALREASLEVFDRTFTVTVVLRMLAVLVAFVGVLSALMALQLERAREFAVLHAVGMEAGRLRRLVTLQTGLMGLFAGLLSLPLGLLLAGVLVHVINKRSFGWTLQLEVPPEMLLQAVGVALVAAVLAGLYPAFRMGR